MKRQKILKASFKSYVKAMIVFVVFILVCSFSFFFYIQKDIKEKSIEKVVTNTEKQTESLKSYVNVQYRYLEGIGNYISTKDLFSDENIKLIQSIKEYTKLENIGIMDMNGESHYDNGAVKNVAHRQYFKEAIKGKRVLSDPLSSSISSKTRVILAVPIYDQDKNVVGVLGGSYDIGRLNKIFFKGIYDGKGTAFIASKEGELISHDVALTNKQFLSSKSIFHYFKQYDVLSNQKIKDLKQKFTYQKDGYVILENKNTKSYLAYYPLKVNDWMMCYKIDAPQAQSDYKFVVQAEYQLLILVVLAVIALLFAIFRLNNRYQRRLIDIAKTDPLTGIKNKESLKREITQYINNQPKNKGALFMIDVDNFKEVNDLNGHVVGDEVLKLFASTLKNTFNDNDIVGRAGGDEFIVFMKDIEDYSIVESKAQEACQNIREIYLPGLQGKITCSIGIAFYPLHGKQFKELYKFADQALYLTKDHGKNGYTCYK